MKADPAPPISTSNPEQEVITRITPQIRELAVRDNDGIRVALLWHPHEDSVTVSVEDSRAGQHFDLAVAADQALEAFYHPFAYAA
jgi:hypothetical protein